MNCPSCGHENREGAGFCAECGTSLSAKLECPDCRRRNTPGAKFCDGCGQSLQAAQQQTPGAGRAPAPEPGAPPSPTSFAAGRYRVERFLGEGAKKRVYLAHDTRLDRDVAIGVIKTEGLDADTRVRVEREARAMGRLGEHPHVVNIYDVVEDAAGLYVISQYVAGGDLEERLREAPDHRLPVEEALRTADQLCQALEHAHAREVIHRDLKPGNVYLAEDGAAKLGDFGLAVSLDRTRLTREGTLLGTATYMPPEQAMGEAADATSDLYSLGAMLYELVTGRPPFVGDESVAVITQHLNTPPVAPSWHRPDLPPALDVLILRLLEKDREARPASATQVREAIAAIETDATLEAPREAAVAPAPVYGRLFVGREAELAKLKGAFDAALSGDGGLFMVVGEPGIGKTTVCEQLATYSAVRGGRTLVGHCYEEGSLSLPYLAFVEALRSYVLAREPDELARELGSGAADVARIVSELRDRIDVELAPPGNPEEERYRLFQAVTGFLRNAAAVQPLVVVLEDLHDADRGTLELLTHVARNLVGARLLVVGTYRDVEVDRAHPLSSALAELRRAASFQRIPLRGLSADEVQRMISGLAGHDVPWGVAEAVHRQTEGNPLFIQEVLRYLAEEGLIRREGGRWQAAGDSPLEMSIPEGLRDVIGKRLSRLSTECNALLSIAAVIGREFELATLREVGGIPEEELLSALEEAVHTAVLEEQSRPGVVRYRFAHAFFRQTLYEEMIAPRRLRLHQQVARALEAQHADRLAEHAAELGEHFAHSSDPADLEKAVGYGRLAAERAMAVFAHGEAVRLLDQALAVQSVLDPDDAAARCDLLLALGDALLPSGEPRRLLDEVALDAFERAEALGDDERAARACELALDALNLTGGVFALGTPEAVAWLERAEPHAIPGTRYQVRIDQHRVVADTVGGEHRREGMERMLRSVEAARCLDDSQTLADALGISVFWLNSPERDRPRLAQAQELEALLPSVASPSVRSMGAQMVGAALLTWGERERAEALFREAITLEERTGGAPGRLTALGLTGLLAALDGRLEEACALAERVFREGERQGLAVLGQLWASMVGLFPLLHTGRAEQALEFSMSPWSRTFCLAALGRQEEARGILGLVMGNPLEEPPTFVLLLLLHAAVLLGDQEGVASLMGLLEPAEAPFSGTTYMTSVARHCGEGAALLGQTDRARAYFESAIEATERIRFRPELALSRLDLAELLFEHYPEEASVAAALLNAVVPELRDMKMQPALERALRLKLDAAGLSATDVNASIYAVAHAVQRDEPDLTPHAAPDGTVTLLFSDMQGFTEMTERLGDVAAREVIRAHNAIVRKQLAAHGGYEVELQGDGFLLAFGSARKALACAVAIQRAFAAYSDDHSDEPIRVRIGLHTGEALKDADKFFGKTVILASRIAAQAQGGEILVSALLKGLVESAGDVRFGAARELDLKGISERQRVFQVDWQ